MIAIGVSDAKAHFSTLLERASKGESITITRHGVPIARLVPVAPALDQAKRAAAIGRLKALAQRYTLGGLDLKALRDEGRK